MAHFDLGEHGKPVRVDAGNGAARPVDIVHCRDDDPHGSGVRTGAPEGEFVSKCCDPVNCWCYVSHGVACALVLVYVAVRWPERVPTASGTQTFQWLWTVHFAYASLNALIFLISCLFHATSVQWECAFSCMRSLDIGFICLGGGAHFFLDSLLATVAFWLSIRQSSPNLSSQWNDSMDMIMNAHWQTLLDPLITGTLAFTAIVLSIHSGNHPTTLAFKGSRAWLCGLVEAWVPNDPIHFINYSVVGTISITWIVVAATNYVSLPHDLNAWYLLTRILGIVVLLIFLTLERMFVFDRCCLACGWTRHPLTATSLQSVSWCSMLVLFPRAHAIWHIASFLAISVMIASNDYILGELEALYALNSTLPVP